MTACFCSAGVVHHVYRLLMNPSCPPSPLTECLVSLTHSAAWQRPTCRLMSCSFLSKHTNLFSHLPRLLECLWVGRADRTVVRDSAATEEVGVLTGGTTVNPMYQICQPTTTGVHQTTTDCKETARYVAKSCLICRVVE